MSASGCRKGGFEEMDRKPNIIFFFSDQQRWDTAGCYGQCMPVTPNLDCYRNKIALPQGEMPLAHYLKEA